MRMQKKDKKNRTKGQVTLEFTFCLFVVLLIFYSCVKTMQWLGRALAKPGIEHQAFREYDPGEGVGTRTASDMGSPLEIPTGDLPPLDIIYRGEPLVNPN